MVIEKGNIYRNEIEFKDLAIGDVFFFEYTKQVYVRIEQAYPWTPNAFSLDKNRTVEFNDRIKVIKLNYEMKVWG